MSEGRRARIVRPSAACAGRNRTKPLQFRLVRPEKCMAARGTKQVNFAGSIRLPRGRKEGATNVVLTPP